MQISNELREYISESKFLSSYSMQLNEVYEPLRRIDFLVNMLKGKKVIHVGCVDHVELIEEKINQGTYLHKRLSESCEKCIGIDINKKGIELLKERYQFENVYDADLMEEPIEVIVNEKWDLILLGEILEHVDNPVLFLSKIREHYSGIIDEIVITVPNVLNNYLIKNMRKKQLESINSDHMYWFSPYTILRVMHKAGIRPLTLGFAGRIPLSMMQLLIRKVRSLFGLKEKNYPFFYFNTLIARGKL